MPIATSPAPTALLPSNTTLSTLPPPQTFDLLPPLHALLSRLLLPRDPNDPSTPSPDTITPLSPKELSTAASAITNKIQKARGAVRELPGVEMSLEEQEDVIAELEGEVRRLDGVLEGVRGRARKGLAGVEGKGGEGGEGEGRGKGMDES